MTPSPKRPENSNTTNNRLDSKSNHKNAPSPAYLFWKRFFDIFFSFLLILLLALPMLLITVWIRIDSKGPAIFRQIRHGKNGALFTIYKFRTMRIETPSECASNSLRNPEDYITRVGRFLRRTSIDELPQLFNILRGEMSFVGYRPVCTTETLLNTLRQENGVFSMRPGLTGLAQIHGRDLVTCHEKANLDLQYKEKCSLRTDLYCLYRTVCIVLSGEGILQ